MNRMLPGALILAVALAMAPVTARAENGASAYPEVIYGHKDGMALTFNVFKPKGKQNGAAILFMVSGGYFSRWTSPEKELGRYQPFLDKGFTLFSVRHGSNPRYNIPEIVDDVRRAVRFIRLHAADYGIDEKRIGVFGGSAGGHLTLMLATASDDGDPSSNDEVLKVSDRIAAAVAYYPPVDMRTVDLEALKANNDPKMIDSFKPAFNFPPEKAESVSPLAQVSPDDPPTLLIHGEADHLVTVETSKRIYAEFQKQKVTSEMILIPGAGHGFKGEDAKKAEAATVAWFEKYLAAK